MATALSALVEFPAYPLVVWALDAPWAGRKPTVAGSLSFGGLCCLLSALAGAGEGPPLMKFDGPPTAHALRGA